MTLEELSLAFHLAYYEDQGEADERVCMRTIEVYMDVKEMYTTPVSISCSNRAISLMWDMEELDAIMRYVIKPNGEVEITVAHSDGSNVQITTLNEPWDVPKNIRNN
jgi:hypothetical protein